MKTTRILATAAAAVMALPLIAAHGVPGADDNRGKALNLTTQAAIDANDGDFGAYEGGEGHVKLFVDLRNDQVCLQGDFHLQGDDEVNLLHIHEKTPEGNPQTGGVVVSWDRYIDFVSDGIATNNTNLEDGITEINRCVAAVEGFDIQDLLNESSEYYINAHIITDAGAPVIRAELDKDLVVGGDA